MYVSPSPSKVRRIGTLNYRGLESAGGGALAKKPPTGSAIVDKTGAIYSVLGPHVKMVVMILQAESAINTRPDMLCSEGSLFISFFPTEFILYSMSPCHDLRGVSCSTVRVFGQLSPLGR